jgi:hypothetical protein
MIKVIVIVPVLVAMLLMSAATRSVQPDPRFGSLDPDRPVGYVELGVEKLALGDSVESRTMARELLVRGAFYAVQRGDGVLASSACMALLDLVDASERGRIRDLALVLDPSRLVEWSSVNADAAGSEIDRRALACVSLIRYHDVSDARALWGEREVRERVREAAARAGIDPGRAVTIIDEELGRAMDDPCRGRLYVSDRDDRGQRRVCPNHLRGVGLSANDDRLGVLLAVEARLSGAQGGAWREEGGGAGLALPTIEDLVRISGVDVSRPFYRGGAWTR